MQKYETLIVERTLPIHSQVSIAMFVATMDVDKAWVHVESTLFHFCFRTKSDVSGSHLELEIQFTCVIEGHIIGGV